MKSRLSILIISICILAATLPAWSDTYLVKPDGTGDFPTIQDAVDSVIVGDIIELADGIFTGEGNREIVVEKAITIRSASGDPDLCIVDCEANGYPGFGFMNPGGSVPRNGEATLENITIRNAGSMIGGAVLCGETSPTISGCKMYHNLAYAGGAIAGVGASPRIVSCTIEENLALYAYGGGVFFMGTSAPVIENSTVSRNWVVFGNVLPPSGGEPLGRLMDRAGEISGDWPFAEDRGPVFPGGAGIYCVDSCSVTITGGMVSENLMLMIPVKQQMAVFGLGISCTFGGTSQIVDCRILDNDLKLEPPPTKQDILILGGGVGLFETDCELKNCTIGRNLLALGEDWNPPQPKGPYPFGIVGGGVCSIDGPVRILGCTVTDNLAYFAGGIFIENAAVGKGAAGEPPAIVAGTVVAKNGAMGGGGLWMSRGSSYVAGSTITGNAANQGGGLIFSPLFFTKDKAFGPAGYHGNPLSRLPGRRQDGIPVKGPDDQMLVENTILWENCALSGLGEEGVFELPVSFACCDADSEGVEDLGSGNVTWGPKNIFVDPLFCTPVVCKDVWVEFPYAPDANFHLTEGSPCAPKNSPDCGLIGALDAGCSECRVLRVPEQYPTIQSALNAAAECDTIVVACGTYYAHHLYLKSGVVLRSETGECDCAVIDGNGQGVVVYCSAVQDAVLEGFTITGGTQGGMYCGMSTVDIIHCCFVDNTSNVHGAGGLYCYYSSPTLMGCSFTGNGCAYNGGGIQCYNSPAILEDCVFVGNSADFDGGGLYCYESNPTLSGCTFFDNTADDGGAILCEKSSPAISHSLFAGNTAPGRGGGMACYNHSSPSLQNCTFSEGWAVFGAGLYCWRYSSPMVDNTIIAFSTHGDAVQCLEDNNNPVLTCCDVYGNAGGDWVGCIAGQFGVDGNFSADPLFCDAPAGDFTIEENSPCTPSNSPNDCGLVGALGIGCGITLVHEREEARGFYLAPSVPNPFNPTTEIEFSIPSGTEPFEVTLTVYNSLGQRVRTLVDCEKAGGIYRAVWDGTDENRHQVASGVYFYRLVWNGESMTRRMVLLK